MYYSHVYGDVGVNKYTVPPVIWKYSTIMYTIFYKDKWLCYWFTHYTILYYTFYFFLKYTTLLTFKKFLNVKQPEVGPSWDVLEEWTIIIGDDRSIHVFAHEDHLVR